MTLLVAIVGQGSMGAGLARVLRRHGADVITTLTGRSEASKARAAAAGMQPVPAVALPFARSVAAPARN